MDRVSLALPRRRGDPPETPEEAREREAEAREEEEAAARPDDSAREASPRRSAEHVPRRRTSIDTDEALRMTADLLEATRDHAEGEAARMLRDELERVSKGFLEPGATAQLAKAAGDLERRRREARRVAEEVAAGDRRESTAAAAANAAPRVSLKQRLAALGDAQPPTATRSRRAVPGEAVDGSGAFFAAVAGAAALAFAALLVAATFGGRRGERGSDAARRVLLAAEAAG